MNGPILGRPKISICKDNSVLGEEGQKSFLTLAGLMGS